MDIEKRSKEQTLSPFVVKTCFGPKGCPNAILPDQNLAEAVASVCQASGLEDFLTARFGTVLKRHHQFRITIAHCPNGCSQPQIVDIGILAAARVAPFEDAECTRCEACVKSCPEQGIMLDEGGAVLNPERCLNCGHCASACPTGRLVVMHEGYRVQLGGRLGRRPQLAREMAGVQAMQDVLELTQRSLDHFMAHSRPGERFGDVLNRVPLPGLRFKD